MIDFNPFGLGSGAKVKMKETQWFLEK